MCSGIVFEWDGALDQSFPNGSLLVDGMWVRAAAVDSSKRIVVVGEADGVFMTVRLTANGALDSTFGGDGVVYTSFSGPAEATAVAIRPNGSILTAGTVAGRNKSGMAVACYTSGGGVCAGVNQGWGTLPGSRIETWFASDAEVRSIAVAADGSFVVAGGIHLARYSPYGTLAASFGDGGKKVLEDADVLLWDVAFDALGNIVAGGLLHTGENASRFSVMRFGPDGDSDPSFGTGGIVTAFYGCSWAWGCVNSSAAYALAIDTEGGIVVGGYANKINAGIVPAITRFLPTGTVDPGFGYVIPPGHLQWRIFDVRISAGDRIWIAGIDQSNRAFVGRLTFGGNLDAVFVSGADPATVQEGMLKVVGCPGFGVSRAQVVEQNVLRMTGPNTISVEHKAVLIGGCPTGVLD